MFHSARLKLTTWYLAIIMLVSLTFSLVIYNVLINEVSRFDQIQRLRITRFFQQQKDGLPDFLPHPIPAPNYDPELVAEVRARILTALILVNAGIFVMAGILGYILAGRTLKPIQEMLDEQNRFISDASHELRTPLTSLKTAFEVYLRQSQHTQKEAKTIVTESLSEVNRLIALSHSLLQLAEVDSSSQELYAQTVELGTAAQAAVKTMRPIAKAKKIQISSHVGPETVKGNYYALVELISILLDNAIKYSPSGKVVKVFSHQTGATITLSIEDQGVGIAGQDLPHIFDRFYRADSARSSEKVLGYGLGLPIAKKIVSAHGGTLTVNSTPGKGSTFAVRLPSASFQK